MKDKKSVISIILSIVAICAAVAAIVICISCGKSDKTDTPVTPVTPDTSESGDVQYVLYLGTNDKDTNERVFSPEKSKEVLKGIRIKSFGGYSIQEANGGWIGDDGKEYQEYTLVIYLSDTTEDKVHALCDELIKTYNQSSVLIQKNRTQTEFYSTSGE